MALSEIIFPIIFIGLIIVIFYCMFFVKSRETPEQRALRNIEYNTYMAQYRNNK